MLPLAALAPETAGSAGCAPEAEELLTAAG
jgi:hypothetical protein